MDTKGRQREYKEKSKGRQREHKGETKGIQRENKGETKGTQRGDKESIGLLKGWKTKWTYKIT